MITQARADRRALICAALIGSGVGLGLGATYLAGGMGRAAVDHIRAARIAEAAQGGFSETMLQREMKGMNGAAIKIARAHDRFAASADGSAVTWPGRPDERFPVGRHASALDAARDLDCLTQAVYYEARSEAPRGQAAVAQVVLNRVANPNFPKSVCAVVFQGASSHGCQFSFACDGSMRHGLELAAWNRARRIAERALSGVVEPEVGKATHYHTVDVSPYWGAQMLRVTQVGLHVFYRRNPHAPVVRPEATEHAVFVKLPLAPNTPLRLSAAIVEKAADAAQTAVAPPPRPPVTVARAAKPAEPSEPAALSASSEPAAS